MKFKLYTANTFPPTDLFNSSTRTKVPVTAEPHEGGWLVETDNMEAAATSLKDFGYLLMEPAEFQFPQVPNFDGDYTPERFKFRKPTNEEFKLGKYLPFAERMAAQKQADKAADLAKTKEELDAEEAEAEEIRKKLTEAGIKFHPATGLVKLRRKLEGLDSEEE